MPFFESRRPAVPTFFHDPPSFLRRSSTGLAEDLGQLSYALDKLLSRSLRRMFDGSSTVPLRWDGPAPDQLDAASRGFGLTEPERHIVGHLARGRALWKVAGRSAVVQHMLTTTEAQMCDTDSRMSGQPAAVATAA